MPRAQCTRTCARSAIATRTGVRGNLPCTAAHADVIRAVGNERALKIGPIFIIRWIITPV